MFSHRSTPYAGLSYPPLEPIAPPSNSQLFSPVNGAQSNIDALFGANRADTLRERLQSARHSPSEREFLIIASLTEALQEMGGNYVITFRFKNDAGTRTSHHLVFVTKHDKGHDIMKEIMAKASSGSEQGVPTFEYNPKPPDQMELLSRPLDDLTDMLLNEFAGQTLTMLDVYKRHNRGTRYIQANYKDVLSKLEEENKIISEPPSSKRPRRYGKPTFGPNVIVSFPKQN